MDDKLKDLAGKPSYSEAYTDLLMRVAAAAQTFVRQMEKGKRDGRAINYTYNLLRLHTEAFDLFPDFDKVNAHLERGLRSLNETYQMPAREP